MNGYDDRLQDGIEDEGISEYDAFNGGIEPGGLRNRNEIRLLVCYILKNSRLPVSREKLGEIMNDAATANYFETMDAVSKLLENKSIEYYESRGENYLRVTAKGGAACEVVEDLLPRTVREKAAASARELIMRNKNEKENNVRIEHSGSGFTVSFSMEVEGSALMELRIYAPDIKQAELIRDNFTAAPSRVYSAVLDALTGTGQEK